MVSSMPKKQWLSHWVMMVSVVLVEEARSTKYGYEAEGVDSELRCVQKSYLDGLTSCLAKVALRVQGQATMTTIQP